MLSFSSTDRLILNYRGPPRREVRESVDPATVSGFEFQGESIFRVLGAKRMTYSIRSAAPLGQRIYSARDTVARAGARAGAGLLALTGDPIFVAGALGLFGECDGKLI